MQKNVERNKRFLDNWFGHTYLKVFAVVSNIVALIETLLKWEFGTNWDKLLFHANFGTIPIHFTIITLIVIVPNQCRDMSVAHDLVCMVVCWANCLIMALMVKINGHILLFMFSTGFLMAFELTVHIATEYEIRREDT